VLTSTLNPFDKSRWHCICHDEDAKDAIVVVHLFHAPPRFVEANVSRPCFRNARGRALAHDRAQPECGSLLELSVRLRSRNGFFRNCLHDHSIAQRAGNGV
jgi:hypothetical protein